MYTGALFLGAARLLGGLEATMHHRALEPLRQICIGARSEPISIVKKRVVDRGVGKAGPAGLIMPGSISGGSDATLHIVLKQTSRDIAEFIGRVMEYEWGEKECGFHKHNELYHYLFLAYLRTMVSRDHR